MDTGVDGGQRPNVKEEIFFNEPVDATEIKIMP
jgi:hypothetical protein